MDTLTNLALETQAELSANGINASLAECKRLVLADAVAQIRERNLLRSLDSALV